MNKTDLIEKIAKSTKLSKADAGRAVDAMIETVTEALRKNDSVTLMGFGTFAINSRAERVGCDPRTRLAIKIKAAKVPKFRPGKALRDAVK
jgi:DNA-binding protein HU-beta